MGSISVGKYADFVELTADPYTVDPARLAELAQVVGTWVAGQRVDLGLVATVTMGGIKVVLTTERAMPFDTLHLRCAGILPEQERIISLKCGSNWRVASCVGVDNTVLDGPASTIWPRSSTRMRSAKSRANSTSCVEMSSARPSSARSRSDWPSAPRRAGSSADVGDLC